MSLTLEWRGVRQHRHKRAGSVWIMRDGKFESSFFGFLRPGETDDEARERMTAWVKREMEHPQ